MENYINIEWADLFDQILDGIRRIFDFFKKFAPKAVYNFTIESEYKVD